MNKLSPLIKGLITGVVLVAVQLLLYQQHVPGDSSLRYLVYALFAAGIFWTLWDFSRTPAYTGKFGELFSQGFRCFMMIIVINVAYVGIFRSLHPELADQASLQYKEALVKEGNRSTPQIEELVAKAKKNDTMGHIYLTIFSTLVMGAFFTAAIGIFINMRGKKTWTSH